MLLKQPNLLNLPHSQKKHFLIHLTLPITKEVGQKSLFSKFWILYEFGCNCVSDAIVEIVKTPASRYKCVTMFFQSPPFNTTHCFFPTTNSCTWEKMSPSSFCSTWRYQCHCSLTSSDTLAQLGMSKLSINSFIWLQSQGHPLTTATFKNTQFHSSCNIPNPFGMTEEACSQLVDEHHVPFQSSFDDSIQIVFCIVSKLSSCHGEIPRTQVPLLSIFEFTVCLFLTTIMNLQECYVSLTQQGKGQFLISPQNIWNSCITADKTVMFVAAIKYLCHQCNLEIQSGSKKTIVYESLN